MLNLKISHVGYPRSPLSLRPLSMPCYFYATPRVFSCSRAAASSCVRAPTPDCIRGIFCSRAPMPDRFPSSNAVLCPNSNAGLYPGSNAGLYPRCHITLVQKSRRSLAELNAGNALYEASHSRLSFMPNYFRGDAPPRLCVDFLSIFFIGAIYSLPRYIASSPHRCVSV